MKVRELLTRKPTGFISIDPSATTAAAARLLIERGVGGLAVMEASKLVGFVSERDMAKVMTTEAKDVRSVEVGSVMHRPAPTCSVDAAIREVMARMTRERLRHLVVMDGDQVVGVISVGDIVKHRLEQLETEAGVLRDYVAAQRARG